jgi:hypothetical protein
MLTPIRAASRKCRPTVIHERRGRRSWCYGAYLHGQVVFEVFDLFGHDADLLLADLHLRPDADQRPGVVVPREQETGELAAQLRQVRVHDLARFAHHDAYLL